MSLSVLLAYLNSNQAVIGLLLFISSEIIGQLPIPSNGVLALLLTTLKDLLKKMSVLYKK